MILKNTTQFRIKTEINKENPNQSSSKFRNRRKENSKPQFSLG